LVASRRSEWGATLDVRLLAEAQRLNQAGYPAPLLAWQPHLRAITDVAAAREDAWGAVLCNQLGYHLERIAYHVWIDLRRLFLLRLRWSSQDNSDLRGVANQDALLA